MRWIPIILGVLWGFLVWLHPQVEVTDDHQLAIYVYGSGEG